LLQLSAAKITQVRVSTMGCSMQRIRVTCAVLLALVAILEVGSGHDRPDDVSYGVGYNEAPKARVIRSVMTRPGVTPTSLCANLWEHFLLNGDSTGAVIRQDFLRGCKHAIGDAME
jgi:hypothetical protein